MFMLPSLGKYRKCKYLKNVKFLKVDFNVDFQYLAIGTHDSCNNIEKVHGKKFYFITWCHNIEKRKKYLLISAKNDSISCIRMIK